ncbi:MAG: hypothetical protein QNK37_26395 [Acidobacteriota bacterium]|nr:hypothetical protein [Acidobacteriota bacterium]
MLKKSLAILVIALGAAPLFADVELQTSINDVFNRGSSELAGSITMTVNDDDFTNASTSEPVYIRVTPDHNSSLAETLVNQTDGVWADPADRRYNPIFLAMELVAVGGALEISADEETVSIVRWVAGESSFWIRVQTDSDTWIRTVGSGPMDPTRGPDEDAKVSWTLGVSARASIDDHGEKSNLPFNTRNPNTGDTDWEFATSTLLCVNLQSSDLADSGIESLLRFDIISFDEEAAVEFNSDNTPVNFSGLAGDQTGIDFTNDFNIARGKKRDCRVVQGEFKNDEPPRVPLCIPAAAGNAGLGDTLVPATNVIDFDIVCAIGGNQLETEIHDGAYVEFSNGSRGAYGFKSGAGEFGSVNSEGVFSPFANSGSVNLTGTAFDAGGGNVLWPSFRLVWNDGTKKLSQTSPTEVSFGMTIQVTTHYYFANAATDVILDWDVTLKSHEGAADTGINPELPGPDQNRRCPPSDIDLEGGEWNFAEYIPCAGTPVVLFFPYVPKTFDTGFWVGLSYVNQGSVPFAEGGIEAIFYNESGDRFSTADDPLPALPIHNQMTWILQEDELGAVALTGAGLNNADVVVTPLPTDPTVPADSFGVTRMSMFLVGNFEAEFQDEQDDGDLDGYLLIGNGTSVDGAYLPRNWDARDSDNNQFTDLPIQRSKRTR